MFKGRSRVGIHEPEAIECLQLMLLWVKEKGYSQNYFDRRFGISRKNISYWMAGNLPTGKSFKRFYEACHILGCPHAAEKGKFDWVRESC